MHIAKLRKKIEDNPQDPTFIVTVHGVGYKFTG
jgi:two-component system torCAD operon response regulator TorR